VSSRLLLDTNALFWALRDPDRLDPTARAAIESPTSSVYATLASAQEFAIKIAAKKWPEALPVLARFEALILEAGFGLIVPTAVDHLNMTRLPDVGEHRDPFDRLIVAMAIARGLVLVSSDGNAQNYAVEWLRAGSGEADARRGRERIMPAEPLTPIALD